MKVLSRDLRGMSRDHCAGSGFSACAMCRWRHVPRAAHCPCGTAPPLPADREIGAAERVANERRRDDVRDLLTLAGMTAKVAVCPAWFVATVGD